MTNLLSTAASADVPDLFAASIKRFSLNSWNWASFCTQGSEVLQHPLGIRLDTGEEAESLGGLKDCHAAAIQRAATQHTRGAQQFGLRREINDLGNPEIRAQQGCGQRQTWVLSHADWRRVDQPVRSRQRCGDVGGAGDRHTIRAEARRAAFCYRLGTLGYHIDAGSLLDRAT